MEVDQILPQVEEEVKDFVEKTQGQWVVVIWWATATGKTALSLLLAKKFPVEIISADSRQVYRYMDIGTDKVSREIRQQIPHHQIDIVDPDYFFTAWERKEQVEELIPQILAKWKIPIVVGWTGLYIDMIYKNFPMPKAPPDFEFRKKLYEEEKKSPWILYQRLKKVDPQEAQKIHPHSLRYIVRALEIYHQTGKPKSAFAYEQPVKWPLLMLGLRRQKQDTNRRINKRIMEQIQEGLVDEVKWLLQRYDPSLQSMQGLGYKEIIGYLQGKYSLDKAIEILKRNTHRYAKRQRTWFRRYIADGKVSPKENVWYKVYDLSGD